jgi:hypothetical protein
VPLVEEPVVCPGDHLDRNGRPATEGPAVPSVTCCLMFLSFGSRAARLVSATIRPETRRVRKESLPEIWQALAGTGAALML